MLWNQTQLKRELQTKKAYAGYHVICLASRLEKKRRGNYTTGTDSRIVNITNEKELSMNTAIILHGMPSKEEYFDPKIASQSNLHWIPWLQRELLLKGILAQTPELPKPYAPNYEAWSECFEQFKVNEQTLLIGHSCGGGFLVRWLSEHKIRVGKIALVAPFIDPDGDEVPVGFFPFSIDPQLSNRASDSIIFVSPDDEREIHDSVKAIAETTHIPVQEIENRGHFTFNDMKTNQFPELRDWLV